MTSISPPFREIVAISLRPALGGMNQNAMRSPFGDHEGCIASFSTRNRFSPVSTFAIHKALAKCFSLSALPDDRPCCKRFPCRQETTTGDGNQRQRVGHF